MALHGLEEAAGVRYGPDGIRIAKGSPVLVRYCDDFVVCCRTRQQAEQVRARLAGWLAPRGLAFSDEKTKIVSLESGYDFLGFNIRRYRNGKLLIKAGKAAVGRVKHKLAEADAPPARAERIAVLAAICPITRGWASFYRSVVSRQTFNERGRLLVEAHLQVGLPQPPRQAEALDHQTVLRPVQPVQAEQLGLRRRRQRRLPAPASLDPHHPAPQGHRPGLTRRPRPDQLLEPAARHRTSLRFDRSTLRLLKMQHGRCALCADLLLHADREPHTPEEWQRWHRTTRKAITRQLIAREPGTPDTTRLIHAYCQRRATGSRQPGTGIFTHLNRPSGLA